MKTMKMVRANALRSKIARLKDVARQATIAARQKNDRELLKIARDIRVLAADEEEKLEQLQLEAPPADDAAAPSLDAPPPPAPVAEDEESVRKELYDALKQNKLDEASAALGKLRRLARSKRRSMADGDDLPPPPAPHVEPDGDELPPPPAAPPADPAGPQQVLSAREHREIRAIAHRVRVEGHPDLAAKLRALLK